MFFRKVVVRVEGQQPAPPGAEQAAPLSPGACRNGETAENSKEKPKPELKGDGKSMWRNKMGWVEFATTKKPWSWLKRRLKESVCKDSMGGGRCVNKSFLFLFCPP